MPRPGALPPLAAEVQRLRSLLPSAKEAAAACDADAGDSSVTSGGKPLGRGDRPVRVLCRFRGQTDAERQRGGREVWDLSDTAVSAGDPSVVGGVHMSFSYDRVFGPEATQAEVYSEVEPAIQEVLGGVNSAVLCYGQTSAGKTFTMEGLEGADCGEELRGIAQRAFATLFDGAGAGGIHCFRLSMLDIYQERLRDLLSPDSRADLKVMEDRQCGIHVQGLQEVEVTGLGQALDVLRRGQGNRATGATGMNDRSSRSHSIVILQAEDACRQRLAKLCLVDLAGSECLKKACLKANADADAKARQGVAAANAEIAEEAKCINQSLTVLALVINRLADRKRGGGGGGGYDPHVPYRSSKLTRVLQDTLGGNSRTVVIVNCAGSSLHASETMSTLRFGARAQSVVNTVTGHPASGDSLMLQTLQAARQEIERLHALWDSRGALPLALPLSSRSFSPAPEGRPSPLPGISPRRLSRAGVALTDPEANAAAVPALPRFSRASRSHRARESMGGSPRNNGDWSPLELSPRSTARDRRISFAGESPQRSCRPSVAGVFSPLALSEADGPGCRPSTAAHPTRDLQSLPTPARRRSRWTAPAPAPRARPELELASAQTWEYPLSNQEKVQRERWVNTQMHDLAVVEVSELKEDLAAKEHECREKEMNEGTLAARCCALQCDLEWALHRSSLEMSCDLYVGKARERFTAFLAKQVHTSFSSSALWVTFRAWGSAVANAKRAERDEELQRVREGLAEARAEDGRVETELRQEALRLKEELAQEQSARAGADERAHAAEEEAVRLKGELTQEQSARAGADDRVHAADEEAVRLKGELAQEQAARAGADERVHAAEEEAVKLKGELAQEQAARAGADERVQAADQEALRLKGELFQEHAARTGAYERIQVSEEEAERLKGELAQEQAARAAADERVQAADQEALRLKGELSQEQAARAGADEQVHAASEEAERLKGELAKEQAARAGADERVLAADEEALRLRGELSQEQAARAGADEQVHAASEEALRLKGELSQEQAARAGADDQVRAAEEEAERLKRELAQEQSTRAAADERVQAAEQEALRLKGELSQEQAARAGADERIQASEEEALRLKGELSQEQAACAGADEQVHAAEEEAVRLKGELAREQAARAGADEQVQAADLEALRLKGELAQEQAARAGADEQVQAAEEEAVRLKGELAREQAARAGADEQVQAAELEALRLKGELAQEQAARAGADQQVQAIDVQARALGELSVELQRELERLREAATGAEALAAEGRAEASELRGRLQQERQASAEQGETLQRELSRVQGELFVRVEALRMGTERARRQRELSEEEVRCGQLETAAAKAEASRLQAQLETGELQRLQQQQELSTRLQDSQASAASAQGQAAAFEAKLKALAVKLEETAEASSGPPTPRWSGTDSAKEAVEAARAEKDAALQARREAQESKDAALLEAEAARDRERAALQEAESAQGERQAALREAEAAQGERQAALREAEAAQGERQAALREAEAAQGERQAALEEVARLEAQLGETAQQRLREAADSEQQRALEEEAPPLARRRHRRACAVLGGGVWRLAKLLLAQLLLRAALDAAGPADPVFAAYGPDALVARAYARGLAAFGSDGPAAGERGTAEAAAAAQDAGAGTEDPGERRRRERDALEEAERPSAEAGQAEEEEQVVEAAREEEHERFEPEVAQPPQQSPRGAPAEAAAPGEAAAEAPPTAAPGEAASDEPAGPEERGPGTAAAAAGSADPPPATGDGHDEAAANEPPVAPKAVGAAAAGGDGSEADATADATADGDEFPGAEKVQKPLAFVVFLATWVLYRPV